MASADDAFKASFSCPSGCYSACPDSSCGQDLTSYSYDYWACSCPQVSTEAECYAMDHNGYSFTWYSETCAEKMGDWSYDDAATKCSEDPSSLADLADHCCSNSVSICLNYTTQLCLNEEAFDPTATAGGYCESQEYASTLTDAVKSSFSCRKLRTKYCCMVPLD